MTVSEEAARIITNAIGDVIGQELDARAGRAEHPTITPAAAAVEALIARPDVLRALLAGPSPGGTETPE